MPRRKTKPAAKQSYSDDLYNKIVRHAEFERPPKPAVGVRWDPIAQKLVVVYEE